MNETQGEQTEAKHKQKNEAKKVGFFGRFFQKLDASLKQQADEKAKQGSCCCSDDKGDTCC